ncbi:MAG TPA: alkaline phosphatase family protein [Candidatus Binataceae bacterium]|nr:alkaline phosphatase family protein [Candidatus Binataceae bacterium]
MKTRLPFPDASAILIVLLLLSSCTLISETIKTGGEQRLAKTAPPPKKPGPHVIVFALDGAGPVQLMAAVRSGHAPNLARLLGAERGNGLFEHAYAAPHAYSMLPSSTIADWSAIFTGAAPAVNGVPGDEWFERRSRRFLAPVPVSTLDLTDNTKTVEDDLIGHELKVPTLYERLHVRSYVSLMSVHRGATYYTTVSPDSFGNMILALVKGAVLDNAGPEKSLSGAIDRDSADNAVQTIEKHGVPDLQVVYFPGIDIYTHEADPPLEKQIRYLERVTDPSVGVILDEYRKQGVLENTYVIFISDHAHIPTLDDERHELGTEEKNSPFAAVRQAGFRVRKPLLNLHGADPDYQAVLAYQGFMAYVYLADRSTCRHEHQRCNWARPPRFEEDVIPVLNAFYRSNRWGRPVPKLKGTIDLIFARQPVGPGEDALPYRIFDGHDLISINDYLIDHPRPDLLDLNQRMKWLAAGPYGNRAGDIVLLARACMNIPIQDRYYFAATTHYSWHGSACVQDSHIPFILAQEGGSGVRMRSILRRFGGDSPPERELTPLVESLFKNDQER